MADQETTRQMQARLQQAIIDFNDEAIQGLTREALAAGLDPQEIILGGLAPGLEEVGRLYSEGEYFIPELVMCGNTMRGAMEILDPLIESQGSGKRLGKIIIGTVEGDLHDIGKDLVSSMLRGSGFEMHDLGVNVPAQVFVEQTAKLRPDILALSALLLSTRVAMRDVIDALVEAGLRDSVKVIVGGAPVTQEFADKIGADGYGEDAVQAAHLARRLMGLKSGG
jgi:corrinoid protein of di/trimethylamine methyltransferase